MPSSSNAFFSSAYSASSPGSSLRFSVPIVAFSRVRRASTSRSLDSRRTVTRSKSSLASSFSYSATLARLCCVRSDACSRGTSVSPEYLRTSSGGNRSVSPKKLSRTSLALPSCSRSCLVSTSPLSLPSVNGDDELELVSHISWNSSNADARWWRRNRYVTTSRGSIDFV